MDHISPVFWQFIVKWMTNFALFPPEASKIAPQMDALYFFMVLVSLIGLTLVILLVTSFSILYSKKRHPVAVQIEGSTLLEATWTIIPLGLFLIMFVWGALIYFRVYTPPANAMNIYVVGKQWMWKAEHPGGQHEINALHVPTGRAVQLTLISQDVFHSFSIPAFRVKREAIPGRYTSVWFEATPPPAVPKATPPPPAAAIPATADAGYYYKLGREQAGRNDLWGALRSLNRAIELDPQRATSYNARGYVYLGLQSFANAIVDFSNAIRLRPDYTNAYRNRAIARQHVGDEKGAAEDKRKAAELENRRLRRRSGHPVRLVLSV